MESQKRRKERRGIRVTGKVWGGLEELLKAVTRKAIKEE